ncbi:MAG TPA: metallophosphoesterase [Bacteroidales bacterium]|nr:metallophosphoesterase [Bacteroidales bacterium]
MKKIVLLLSLLFLVTCVFSQQASGRLNQFSTFPPARKSDSSGFHFVVMADRTGGHRDSIFSKAIRKVDLLRPSFVVAVGDLIEGYSDDPAVVASQWTSFAATTMSLDMPFFFVPGNHDYSNAIQAKVWKARFGVSYSHFLYKNVLFLFLNTEELLGGAGKGAISKAQYEYARHALAENPKAGWTFVIMHQPLWTQDSTGYWPQLEHLLAERGHTVFAGHEHHYNMLQRNNGTYITMSTTGGFSRLRGLPEGEFDHVMWVTMTIGGPVFANLMIDGIYPVAPLQQTP